MTRDEAKQLLGGYATNSLTESERKALFAAALDDQELFEELAGEQDLREILALPGAKERLAAAVTSAGATTMSAPEEKKKRAWWLFALAGAASVGLLVFLTTSKTDAPVEVATAPLTIEAPKLEEPAALSPAVDAVARSEKDLEERKKSTFEDSTRAADSKLARKQSPAKQAAKEKVEIAASRAPLPAQPVQAQAPKPSVANGFAPGAAGGVVGGVPGRALEAADAAQLRDALAQAQNGAAKGKSAFAAGAAGQQGATANSRAAAARPDSPPVRAGALTYVLTGRGSLKVTPAVSGSLEVTAADRHIIGWDPVIADSTVEMPVPSGVDSLTLRFAIPGQQPSVVVIPIRQ